MLKIHVLYEHSGDLRPHGCSFIRLLLPLNYPSNQDVFSVTRGTTLASADVVIVERTWRPDISLKMAENLVKQVRATRVCLIYSIDDNILDLNLGEHLQKGFDREKLMVVRYLAREADGVIVSTNNLKVRFSRFNRNVFVVENALDENLLGKAGLPAKSIIRGDGHKTIGFMGTPTHDADLMMIQQALRRTLRKHNGSLELQLIGGVAELRVVQAFNGLPVRILTAGRNVEYPAFMDWFASNIRWDLAIAPLEDDPFTSCKSDIKFLDYSALGIAGIYSRVPAYEKSVRHLETGYLAENDTESWTEAFDCLLADDSLRAKLARNAEAYVFSQRLLKHSALNWRGAILSIIERRTTAAAVGRP
jgi:glycosyltransferase involved in cell wall biosynthesis